MTRRRPGDSLETSPGQKLALLLLGLLLGLTLLEAGLRAGGSMFLWWQERHNLESLARGRPYRILCLGESTTALGGNDSFPRQLEHVLNEDAGQEAVSVINKGIPAADTDHIVGAVPALLDAYRPDAVIAMMGINDPLLEPRERGGPPRRSSLRIVNVANLGLHRLRDWWHPAAPSTAPGTLDVRAKEKRLRASVAADPSNTRAAVELGSLYVAEGKLARARRYLARAVAADPRKQAAHLGLALVYERQGDTGRLEAELRAAAASDPAHPAAQREVAREYLRAFEPRVSALLERVIAAHRDDDASERFLKQAYFLAVDRCRREGRIEEARALLQGANSLPGPGFDEAYYGALGLLALRQGEYDAFEEYLARAEALRPEGGKPMTVRNYRDLRRILGTRGIKLVAVQYPMRRLDSLRRALDDDPEVTFVDNEAVFKEALRHGAYDDYFIDAFAGDFGHLTAEGNRLLAENVARVIGRRLLADG